jgi:hypothetical protein
MNLAVTLRIVFRLFLSGLLRVGGFEGVRASLRVGVDPTVVSPAVILQQEDSFLIPNTKA